MNASRATLRLAVCLATAATALAAHAGRSCEAKPPSIDTITRAMTLAQHAAQALDASGAEVVVLARAGQNLSEYGLRYSHLGYAYRDHGVWRAVSGSGRGPLEGSRGKICPRL